ncbi:hypothetical protein [Acidianus sp. HS-5]|uniref:hypothetical protein n=1 Tax=Acidianus sp. HS-5 TaxID=2886040 RepID=UPI001F32D633|nr:hypothetical protein [Acidianus sp. HS-5]BDC17327.1 hypothetical protein HS5_02170 [Acidianus sp. HS-5]
MDLVNQTLFYTVMQGHTLLYFLLIKIVSVQGNSVLVNITNIDTNGVVLNYTAAMPLFQIICNNSSGRPIMFDGVNAEAVCHNEMRIIVDTYNHLVLSYVENEENFTLNGSTIPIAPGKILHINLPFSKNHSIITTYEYQALALSTVLVFSFYVMLNRVEKRET